MADMVRGWKERKEEETKGGGGGENTKSAVYCRDDGNERETASTSRVENADGFTALIG